LNSISTNGIVRIVLVASFSIALFVGVGGLYKILHARAVDRTALEAGRFLTTATAIRAYTDDHIGPALRQLAPDQFHEEVVPAFAAQTVYRTVQQSYPGYSYSEPALNPTNPNDRPTAFEVELLKRFRANPDLKELQGVREDPGGAVYYLARPIKAAAVCLVCHDTPQRAPAAMVAKYGASNGFGWKLNETVAMQSLTVPAAEELRDTGEIAMILGGGLLLLFVGTYFALTVSIDALVVAPLHSLAKAAEAASTTSRPEVTLPHRGAEEIRAIAAAIERLRISLAKSLARLANEPPDTPQP
jgi:hypothetical protein